MTDFAGGNERLIARTTQANGSRFFQSVKSMIKAAAITWNLLRVARGSSYRKTDWFRSRQESILKRLLNHAYSKVPLYRRLYDEAGFHPSSFRTLDDLERIPPLTKSRLKSTPIDQYLDCRADLSVCEVVATSGSTGVPLRIALGRYEQCWHRAVAWRILFEHGFRWTDRTLEIRMQPGSKHFVQKFGVAPKEWLSILDSPTHWAERLARGLHDCVMAGAGTLDLLADASLNGPRLHPPRIIISDSEPLSPQARCKIRSLLQADPIDVYGLVEVSNFAWQCEQRQGFHISADSHIVEIAAPLGQSGNLLVTALGMWTMPIIRYDTGDLATMANAPCKCGRTLPLLKTIVGRNVDSISTGDGGYLLWPFFHEVLGSEPGLLQWQVRQETLKRVLVNVVLKEPSEQVVARIESRLRGQLPAGLTIQVQPVKSIPLERNGKRRLVIPLQDNAARHT